jgi:hypothetical protein
MFGKEVKLKKGDLLSLNAIEQISFESDQGWVDMAAAQRRAGQAIGKDEFAGVGIVKRLHQLGLLDERKGSIWNSRAYAYRLSRKGFQAIDTRWPSWRDELARLGEVGA